MVGVQMCSSKRKGRLMASMVSCAEGRSGLTRLVMAEEGRRSVDLRGASFSSSDM